MRGLPRKTLKCATKALPLLGLSFLLAASFLGIAILYDKFTVDIDATRQILEEWLQLPNGSLSYAAGGRNGNAFVAFDYNGDMDLMECFGDDDTFQRSVNGSDGRLKAERMLLSDSMAFCGEKIEWIENAVLLSGYCSSANDEIVMLWRQDGKTKVAWLAL